jgi:PAS domain S-box-containing protein
MTVTCMDKPRCQESFDHLVGVFDSFPAALVSVDTRLRIVMFNRFAEQLTGFGSPEVMRRRVTGVIRFGNVRYITGILRGRMELPADGFITKLRAKSGVEIPVQIVVSPLRGPRGELAGFLCVASDLRAVKRFQGKLLEAERLSALSEIAIGLNHAINNPLCAILGNTQLLLMERDKHDPGTVKKLRSIEREISRIQKIAERLPMITRPASRDYVGGRKMLDVEESEHLDVRRRPRRGRSSPRKGRLPRPSQQ